MINKYFCIWEGRKEGENTSNAVLRKVFPINRPSAHTDVPMRARKSCHMETKDQEQRKVSSAKTCLSVLGGIFGLYF